MDMGVHVKYPLFLSYFNESGIFLRDLPRMLKYKIEWKYFQLEPSCSMRKDGSAGRQTDRQTDVKNLVVDFRKFTNFPNYNFASWVYVCSNTETLYS
jgi:hypothetical protein